MSPRRGREIRLLIMLALAAGALTWAVPFAWMLVASLRLESASAADIASLIPSGRIGFGNFREAWNEGAFPLWYFNTFLMCAGILGGQCVTVSAAGYAFARLSFPGRTWIFYLFLLQLMLVPPILIMPNLTTIISLGLYDKLPGVMAPYFASAFGTFLMRQTFRSIPRDYEDAATLGGANLVQLIRHVLLRLVRPGLAAFAIVSVS